MKALDTIAAIATPMGRGGIGIVRISGDQAASIAQSLFRPVKRGSPHTEALKRTELRSRYLHYGHIQDPEGEAIVDEVLLAFMPAPHSYTCENVVEIQSHGGPVILERILKLVIQKGARLAQPGEFTQRAFLNGRIDLSQAEAVTDLINANNEGAAKLAAAQLNGGLRKTVEQLIRHICEMTAELDARIEFPEDVDVPIDPQQFAQIIKKNLLSVIDAILESYEGGQALRDGLRLCIIGLPNVGKSSVLNRLLHKEKAIVTEIPGTTRDLVEDNLIIKGLPIILTDTAGLHESNDPVEKIGMQRTKECLSLCDFILLVVDAGHLEVPENELVFSYIKNKPAILVLNKIDLLEKDAPIHIPYNWRYLPCSQISALNGTGIQALKAAIAEELLHGRSAYGSNVMISNLRHKLCLEKARQGLTHVLESITFQMQEELTSLDLKEVLNELKKITGENLDEDILDTIFKNFCIGK